MNKLFTPAVRIAFACAGLVIVLGTVVSTFNYERSAQAAYNAEINYQGKLTNASNVAVADGDYNMEFKLYDAVSGGSLVWTETRTGADKVTVTNGVFSVMLGEVNAFGSLDFNQTLFLSVNIGGTGSPSWDGEMTPRKKIGTVPVAFLASNLKGTGLVDITNTATQATFNYDGSNRATLGVASNGFTTLTAVGSGAGFNLTGGNVGIATGTTSAKLHVTATTEQLRIGYDAGNYASFTTSSGGDLTIAPSGSDLAVTGNVDVSGTFTSGTGNAFVVDATGNITSGTWAGTALTDANVSNTLTSSIFIGSGSTTNAIDLATAEVAGLLAVGNGGTGVGTFASNGVLYGNTTGAIQATSQGGANTVLIANGGAPSFSAAITVGTSVSSPSLVATTAVTTPSIITSSGALGITPASGSNVNITLATTGDFVVNTDDLYVDTSTGNVGIGDATPAALFTVGSGDLFQINSSGQIGSQQAPVSDYLFALAGTSGNDNSRIIDITQANNAAEDTRAISIVNTASPPSVTDSTREIYNTYSSLTPVTSATGVTGPGELYLYGSNTIVNSSTVTLGDTPNGGILLQTYGNATSTTFSPILNDTDGANLTVATAYGTYSNIQGSPTLTSVGGGANMQSYSGYFANVASSAGNGSLTNTAYGIYAVSSGNLTTSGTTTHYGGYFETNGSAGVNYAIYAVANAPGATTNYAAVLMGGNVGIGTSAPDKALEINSASGNNLRLTYNDADGSAANYVDLLTTSGGNFTLTPSGGLSTITGNTRVTGLSGGGTQCVNVDNDGDLGVTTCGGGTFSGEVDDTTNDALTFASDDASAPAGTTSSIFRDNSGDLNINTVSGKTLNLQIAGSDEYNFSSSGLAFNGNNITGLGTSVAATAGLTIGATGADLVLQTTTSGDISFSPASGLVGFGTAAPDEALHITGVGNKNIKLTTTYSGGNDETLIFFDDPGKALGWSIGRTGWCSTITNTALVFAEDNNCASTRMVIAAGGSVGIGLGDALPDRKLEVLDSSNPQLRLTTTDGTVYVDFQNTSSANLIVSGDTLAASSGLEYGMRITPTVNQTSSASYRALDVNVTETAVTSLNGLNRLADFRVSDSSKVAIANDGTLTLQNASSLVSPYASIGSFQNHLVRSEEFDNASWTKTSVTAPTANTQVGPDGSTTAESLATSGSGGDVCQFTSTAAGSNTFTFSFWARSTSGTQNFDMRVDAGATSCATANNVTGTAVTHTATTSWQRFSVTQTFSGATGNAKARIFPGGTGGTGTIYAAKAQLELSSTANAYALTTGGALTNTNRGESIVSNFATASGFTYGGRHITNLEGSIAASSTTVGQLIRVNDNATGTDDTATVRALEVQSYSGSNINGVNTAIAGFGYTFGIHGVTTAQANESAQPAAVFADLDNGSAPTQGNAIRAYSNNLTSADLVSFYHETTAFTGNGLEMNFGNNSGSFSGNFISLQKGGTQSFHVDDDGSTFVSFTGGGTAHAVCHATNGNVNDDELVDCTSGPSADYAEMYPVDSGIEAGELVAVGTEMVNTYDALPNGDGVNWNDVKGQITRLTRSTSSYQKNLVGIVSDNYADFSSTGYNIKPEDNPTSVALKGRVLVKVTDENGPIKAGDYITSSNEIAGYGTKATRSGQVVGQALADIDFSTTSTGEVMVFVQTGYQSIGNTIVLDAPSANGINLQNGSSSPITNTASTFVIQQQTSGEQDAEANILQLQTGDANRFMVSSTGATSILSNLNCETDAESCPSVLKVTQADTELMNIDARGTLTLAGTIVIKDDTFAGSVATDEDGLAEITFSYHLGTGKPVVQLTAEAQIPVFAQIVEFKQDDNGNYTGFVMKTFDLISGPIQAIVHYNVVGKQAGYITLGEAVVPDEELEFYSSDSYGGGDEVGLIIDGGEVVGNQNDQNEGNPSGENSGYNGSVSGDFTPNNPDDTITTDDGSGSEPLSE